MNVDIILKIAAVGILTAIVGQVLKHTGKDEIATLTTLAGLIITLFMVIDMISSLFSAVRTLFNI
jgi:stage III sporulation protein AC